MIRLFLRLLEKVFRRPYVWIEDSENQSVYRLRVSVTPFGATVNPPNRSGRAKLDANGTVQLSSYSRGKWVPANKYAKKLFEVTS